MAELLNSGAVSSDNTSMGLTLQFAAMALSSTIILRLALAERARLQVELARVRAESGYAVRRERRTAIGANTATMPIDQARLTRTLPVVGPPMVSARKALMAAVTG